MSQGLKWSEFSFVTYDPGAGSANIDAINLADEATLETEELSFQDLVSREIVITAVAIEAAAELWTATPKEGQKQANQVYAAARLAMRYLENLRFENLDMDLPSTQAMLGGLVAGGVVTQDVADAIDAMANGTTTRAQELRINPHAGDVGAARKAL